MVYRKRSYSRVTLGHLLFLNENNSECSISCNLPVPFFPLLLMFPTTKTLDKLSNPHFFFPTRSQQDGFLFMNSSFPRLYGQLKTCKTGLPIWLVVAFYTVASYKLARFLAQWFRLLVSLVNILYLNLLNSLSTWKILLRSLSTLLFFISMLLECTPSSLSCRVCSTC